VRRLDGWTAGISPSWFSECGGQGASGSPAASSLVAWSSRESSETTASSMLTAGRRGIGDAKREGTVSMVNAAGSQSGTSPSQRGRQARLGAGGGVGPRRDRAVLGFWCKVCFDAKDP